MNIKVIENSKLYLSISIVLVVLSLGLFVTKGLNLGIDFTGGSLFQLKFEQTATAKEINTALDSMTEAFPELEKRRVQESENNVAIIRTAEMSEETKASFLVELKTKLSNFEIMKADKVGSTIGNELKGKAIWALLIGSALIVLYITIRFEFRFAIAAIIALIHDILIAIGVIVLLGYEVNTPFIAAMLTILGYSINDTLVTFDRIRENMKKTKKITFSDLVNKSINQVFTRSINTSLTTLLALVALLLFGGDTLRTFIVTLLVGVLSGTYSSIFVASPVVNYLEKDVIENTEEPVSSEEVTAQV